MALSSVTGLGMYAVVVEYNTSRKVAAASAQTQTSSSSSSPVEDPVVCYLPRTYQEQQLQMYWSARPLTALKRWGQIAYELAPVMALWVYEFALFPNVGGKMTTTIYNHDNNDDKVLLQLLQDKNKTAKQAQWAARLRDALTNLGLGLYIMQTKQWGFW